MNIALASALYPPDIAEPAPYVKELAKRLAKTNEVVIVTYASVPEKIPGVRIVAVSKRQILPLRLFFYTIALWRAARKSDVLYIQNGPSVELPAGLVALVTRRPIIMRLGDTLAHEQTLRSPLLSRIEHFAKNKAHKVISESPLKRPEILPLEARPVEELVAYEASWTAHVHMLEEVFFHAKK